MRLNSLTILLDIATFLTLCSCTILQNGQVRITDYPNTVLNSLSTNCSWTSFPPNSTEISYKGRWDTQYISWWSAPGLKFGFQSEQVAIEFGNYTSDGVLLAYRIDGQDWMLSNVTVNSTHLLVDPSTSEYNLTTPAGSTQTFELRVTNWGYGVQIKNILVSGGAAKLIKLPNYSRTMELIGDSLSAGQYATLEGLSSYSWGLMYGLGNVEFSISAYPGICLTNTNCWGNPHGQTYQWFKTPDTSGRAIEIYGDDPPDWDFAAHPAADITVINLGTNDNNTQNNVTSTEFYNSYIELIKGIHAVWPDTQIIVISLWIGFNQVGNTWAQGQGFVKEIEDVVKYFAPNDTGKEPFVHYFNSTGILQHNDLVSPIPWELVACC